jgi:5-methylcytosine-specific restriction endonuclease McrA
MSVLVDLRTLIDGLHDASVCETHDGKPLPPETMRRIACDAEIIPIVLDSDRVVLDVGRERQTATRHQRHALRAMHPTCAYPGCTVRFADCDVHHLIPWQRGGHSDIDNLLPLCSTHHHAAHEGGQTITLHHDRTVTVTHPNGDTLARREHAPPTAA